MSNSGNLITKSEDAASRQASQSERMVHELANLLDGSMRHVGLAIRSVRTHTGSPDESIVDRLETASRAMHEMARLLQTWTGREDVFSSTMQTSQSVDQVLQHAAQLLTPIAQRRAIMMNLHIAEDARDLPAGPISAVIANAMRNSVEAISLEGITDGRIDVNCSVMDEQLHVSVTDNGPGIDASLLDSEGRFQFGHTTKPGGCGLGLALSLDLIEAFGGSLHIDDRMHVEGTRGAELTIRLPIEKLREMQQ